MCGEQRSFRLRTNIVLDGSEGIERRKRPAKLTQPGLIGMHMAVDQPGEHGAPLEIDYLGLGTALGSEHILVGPDTRDLAIFEGHGLRHGKILIDSDDLAVVQNQVGISGGHDGRNETRTEKSKTEFSAGPQRFGLHLQVLRSRA